MYRPTFREGKQVATAYRAQIGAELGCGAWWMPKTTTDGGLRAGGPEHGRQWGPADGPIHVSRYDGWGRPGTRRTSVERDTDGASETDEVDVHAGDGQSTDPVDEMVEESFPASDPPSGWAGEDPRDRPGQAG